LWAMYFVLSLSLLAGVPFIVTDCKGILDGLQDTPQALTQLDKALARTWDLIRHTLDDDFSVMRCRIRRMPSHTSFSGICNAVDSTGRPITILMWRANRLVDGLAKIAAGRHRLPEWAFQMLGAAAQLVKHAAAQLGVVTHRANNHKVTHLIDGGATVTRVCRDSNAEKQQPRLFKVRPPASSVSTSASGGPAPPASSTAPAPFVAATTGAHLMEPNVDDHRFPTQGTKRRRPPVPNSRNQTSTSRAAMQQRQLHLELQEQEQVAQWVASRDLAVSSGPTAQERIERIRQRLRSKQP
jgi:anti-sigma28 factor (negative regulator of flagellin synthesis)